MDRSLIGDAKELDIYGVSLSPCCFKPVIEGFKDGSLPAEGVLTRVLPLKDFK